MPGYTTWTVLETQALSLGLELIHTTVDPVPTGKDRIQFRCRRAGHTQSGIRTHVLATPRVYKEICIGCAHDKIAVVVAAYGKCEYVYSADAPVPSVNDKIEVRCVLCGHSARAALRTLKKGFAPSCCFVRRAVLGGSNRVYASLSDACRANGVSVSSLWGALNGMSKQSAKMSWRYLTEAEVKAWRTAGSPKRMAF